MGILQKFSNLNKSIMMSSTQSTNKLYNNLTYANTNDYIDTGNCK